jgi:hypothetical protein
VEDQTSERKEEKVMPENQATHIHTSAEYESCEECKARATRETRGTPPQLDLLKQWWEIGKLILKHEPIPEDEVATLMFETEIAFAAARVSQPVAPPPPDSFLRNPDGSRVDIPIDEPGIDDSSDEAVPQWAIEAAERVYWRTCSRCGDVDRSSLAKAIAYAVERRAAEPVAPGASAERDDKWIECIQDAIGNAGRIGDRIYFDYCEALIFRQAERDGLIPEKPRREQWINEMTPKILELKGVICEYLRTRAAPAGTQPAQERLAEFRKNGWMVAIHNDYRQNGNLFTFWLFTKGGWCVKGEGSTDEEAIEKAWQLTQVSGAGPAKEGA